MSKQFDSLKTCKIYPENQAVLDRIQSQSMVRITLAALANSALEIGLEALSKSKTFQSLTAKKPVTEDESVDDAVRKLMRKKSDF